MQFYLIYLNIFITSLVIVVGIYKLSALNLALRVLLSLLSISLICDVSLLVMNINDLHNLWLINIYALLEGAFLLLVYFFMLPISKIRKFIPLIAFFYISIGIVEWIFWIENDKLLSLTLIIEALLMLVFSLNAFYILLQKLEYHKIQQNPVFWFNVGILLYFAGALIVFIFSNYILKLPEIGLWMIHNVLHFFYFCSFDH